MSYAAQIAMADRLIRAKGADCILTRAGAGYDPVTGINSGVPSTATFKGVAFPPGKTAELKVGGLVIGYSVEVYLAAKDQTMVPRPTDKLRVQGVDRTVVHVATTDPDGAAPIFHRVYCE